MRLASVFAGLILMLGCSTVIHASIRVDIGPDNGRRDALTRGYENWILKEGPRAEWQAAGLSFELRDDISEGAPLAVDLWKSGYDTGATLASDGVLTRVANEKGALRLTIRGIAPGRHTLTTFHNAFHDRQLSTCQISIDGKVVASSVQPSHRAAKDRDAGYAFLPFDASEGKDVVVVISTLGTNQSGPVVLNGFEIDRPHPNDLAQILHPANRDEHVAANPVLQWKASGAASMFHLYFGTTSDAVSKAIPNSPEFLAKVESTRYELDQAVDPYVNYYWRVDQLAADGKTPLAIGDVWHFRIRRLAFPEAEGYGRFAIGGRAGKVYEVTNLNDEGPGSLREAVEAEGPRTVVFRVGGTIPLKSKLVVRNPYLTVAGQTAPGDGISLRGYTVGCFGTHDVVLRYLRIRVGDEARLTMDGTGFASTDHAIMDHCSVSWSIDEGVSSRGAGNITFQRCLVTEALNIADHKKYQPGKGHSFAASISGEIGSFHHNLFSHCAGRNWSLAGGLTRSGRFAGYLDIRNNVVYNWEHRTTDGGVKALNMVNNLFIPGKATRVFHLLKPDAGTPNDRQQYFMAGNEMEGHPEYNNDNWKGAILPKEATIDEIRLKEPFCESYVTTHSAQEAYRSVMSDVGANFPRSDEIDQRAIRDTLNRSYTFTGSKGKVPGIIDSQSDAGGFPEIKGGEAPTDTDHDGIPDEWELANRLNPNLAADGSQVNPSTGYTWLEDYLNQLPSRK